MLTHVVLMKFTDRTDAVTARDLLEGLAGKVPEIRSLSVGLDIVGSEVSYDLCFTTTHDSAAELRGYQEHPAHLEAAGWLRPRLAARAVVDHLS
ncbi:Dabb family protein [Streptosporangium sp. NBC_01756]|uniref:Dabb family protein n=1 Tax=Streptosporangium sp. NBC_01756 TaxID=2975950 RepID=UPI002DDC1748|nr:Dabb family protein [Streptosporangium sp. NBC_01756]WSC85756.1 Dabb family protein [Streptosporangium sp. NBC_01756]